jgi:hypothetical protein
MDNTIKKYQDESKHIVKVSNHIMESTSVN